MELFTDKNGWQKYAKSTWLSNKKIKQIKKNVSVKNTSNNKIEGEEECSNR